MNVIPDKVEIILYRGPVFVGLSMRSA